MKKIYFISLVLFPFLFSFVLNAQENKKIALEYWGNSDKPSPKVVFYLTGLVIDDSVYELKKIDVTQKEFDSIVKIIEKVKFSSDLNELSDFFVFNIFINNEEKMLKIKNVKKIREIFKNILEQFADIEKKSLIKNILEVYLWRFGYPQHL